MAYFTINETHIGLNGEYNVEAPVTKTDFGKALSYYEDRVSRMSVTNLYSKVYLSLCDETQKQILHQQIIPMAEEPYEMDI